jgi:LuxR family maltose regulon positive regulatory protein
LEKSQSHPLIRTKIGRPRLTSDLVSRQHLVEYLNRGLDRKLTLISAPAGFGKTTLVLSWLEACQKPSVWFSLDKNDNDLAVFLAYFAAAVRTRYPLACENTNGLLEANQLPPLEYIAASLVNDIIDIDERFIIAFDDYHHIQNEDIQGLMTRLIKAQPEKLHIVMTSRADPPLPLAWLRANHMMTEVRASDLRFSEHEAQLFLQGAVENNIDPVVAANLCQSTEGWIVGLRLAALSLQKGSNPEILLDRFRGDTSDFVTNYLVSEVLNQQSVDVREFLLQTSILNRFNADLSNAVCYRASRDVDNEQESERLELSDSQVINEVNNANLFLIPLDETHSWYRYHHLFQNMLRNKLSSEYSLNHIEMLHCRASKWFAEHGYLGEAIDHALSGNDIDFAIKLVEDQSQNLLNPIDRVILEHWLSLLPEEIVWRRPRLLISRAWMLFRQWNITALSSVLGRTESLLVEDTCTSEEKKVIRGHVNTLRCATEYLINSNYQLVLELSEKTLLQLPITARGARSVAHMFRTLSLQALGQREIAIKQVEQIIADPSPQSPAKSQAYITLALLHLSAGDLSKMKRLTNKMFSFAANNEEVNALPGAHYTSGFLSYEWNDLSSAEVHFQAGFDLRYRANFMASVSSYLGLIRIYQLKNRLDESQELINMLRSDAARIMNTDLFALVEAAQAVQDMLQGDQSAALRWARSPFDDGLNDKIFIFQLPILAQARILIELGTAADNQRLQQHLQELLQEMETNRFTNRVIQILAHLALLNQRLGNAPLAIELLQRAVLLAQPGGFVRSFADAGTSIVPLLVQLYERNVATDYISKLLSAFDIVGDADIPELSNRKTSYINEIEVFEPLTHRENDILRLMGRGLTNQEIANQLVISPHTVRAHATKIYAKLGVNSRTRAVHKARQLRILPAES